MNDAVEKSNKPIIDINKENYISTRSSSGSKSLSNGDVVALVLAGLSVADIHEICDRLMPTNDYPSRYSHLNIGMQRMCMGNRIRGFISKRDTENDKIQSAANEAGEDADLKLDGLAALEKAAAPAQRAAATAAAEKAAKAAGEKAGKDAVKADKAA